MSLKTNLKRNLAVIAAASFIGAVGIGGVVTAQADTVAPSGVTTTDTGQPNAQSDGETNDDATDQGPDADPNEPGHQDANDADEADEVDEVGETNDDKTDVGPDADPNEPGHQDAGDVETND